MKPDAYARYFGNDFEAATKGWAPEVKWAYWSCIWHYRSHTHCAGLPNDDDFLRRLCECEKTDWARTKGQIFDNNLYFKLREGKWHQERAERDYLEDVESYKDACDQTAAATAARLAKKAAARANNPPQQPDVTSDVTNDVTLNKTGVETSTQPEPEPQPQSNLKPEPEPKASPIPNSPSLKASGKGGLGEKPSAPPGKMAGGGGGQPQGLLTEGVLVQTARDMLNGAARAAVLYRDGRVKPEMFTVQSAVAVLRPFIGKVPVAAVKPAFLEAVRDADKRTKDGELGPLPPVANPGAYATGRLKDRLKAIAEKSE